MLVVSSPLVFLAVEASQSSWDQARRLLGRPLVVTLLWHSVTRAFAVTVGTAVLG